MSSDRVRKE